MFGVLDGIAVFFGWLVVGMISLFAIDIGRCKKLMVWLCWELSGLRFIWEKLFPPRCDTRVRPPATLAIWLLCVYLLLFGYARVQYEWTIARIEKRANIVFLQLSSPAFKKALSRIPGLQHLPCPPQPKLFEPASVYRSLMQKATYFQMVARLIETIEDWKGSLDTVALEKAYLPKAHLWEADLQEASLRDADLHQAQLWDANLQDAVLWDANLDKTNCKDADLRGADLRGASLRGADLRNTRLKNADLRNTCLARADLRNADLQNADLRGADLTGADLGGARLENCRFWDADLGLADIRNARYVTAESLAKARSLHQTRLDSKIEAQLQETHPHLFTKPHRPAPPPVSAPQATP